MGSTDKFCLRWNDFHENLSVAFRELRNDKDFFDVTLACSAFDETANSLELSGGGGGLQRQSHKTVRAHKLILSACSAFFKDLLLTMNVGGGGTNQQPLIYLSGIEFEDLQCILDFMYVGEVNIAQEKLSTFLAVAEELRVKGLSQNEPTIKENSLKRPLPAASSTASAAAIAAALSTKISPTFLAKKAKLVKRHKDIKTETSPEPKSEPALAIGESSSSLQRQFSESFAGDQSMDDFGSSNEDYLDAMNDSTTGTSEAAGSDGNKGKSPVRNGFK